MALYARLLPARIRREGQRPAGWERGAPDADRAPGGELQGLVGTLRERLTSRDVARVKGRANDLLKQAQELRWAVEERARSQERYSFQGENDVAWRDAPGALSVARPGDVARDW